MEGGVQLLAQQDDLGAHLVAQLGVQVGEGLVHQEDLGIAHHGAADGHALPLAAGEGPGLAQQILGDAQDVRGVGDLFVDLILGHLLQAQGEGDVVIHRHVGVQGVVLEHHGDVAVLGLQVVDHLAVDLHGAAADLFQARDHAQGGGFAAAGGADEDHEFLVMDVQVEVVDGYHVVVIYFFDIRQFHTCHLSLLLSALSPLRRRR